MLHTIERGDRDARRGMQTSQTLPICIDRTSIFHRQRHLKRHNHTTLAWMAGEFWSFPFQRATVRFDQLTPSLLSPTRSLVVYTKLIGFSFVWPIVWKFDSIREFINHNRLRRSLSPFGAPCRRHEEAEGACSHLTIRMRMRNWSAARERNGATQAKPKPADYAGNDAVTKQRGHPTRAKPRPPRYAAGTAVTTNGVI